MADKAVNLLVHWIESQKIIGLQVKVVKEPGRPQVILAVIDPYKSKKAEEETLLFYCHYDKQLGLPEQWKNGLSPYNPVVVDGKLIARGAADDGFATYSIFLSIKACQYFGKPHDRIVVLIEGEEESGSVNLNHYLTALEPIIRFPKIIFILDVPCGDYERFWAVNSIRGLFGNKEQCFNICSF